MAEDDRILVVWNPSSGRASTAGATREVLEGRADVELVASAGAEHATELAREGIERGASRRCTTAGREVSSSSPSRPCP